MKNKILLIVEGEKDEVRILGSHGHGLLSLVGAQSEVVSFANPIYELYDAYKKGDYDDIVSYLRIEKGLKIDSNILSKNAFSAIYLIFDFEPHYHKYSDSTIKDLLAIFNNETEMGKLYINYPTVESYYHLLAVPDLDYNKRCISLREFKGEFYKKQVKKETCFKITNITNYDLYNIIKHNFEKANYICGTNNRPINHELILNKQLEIKNKKSEVYILSTFPFIALDYNNKLYSSLVNNKKKVSKETQC